MKISLNWLKDYIQIDLCPEEIAKILTSAGLEVDSIQRISGGFEGVVVGEVLNVEKHPDADKLCVAQVTDGLETFQVVCGASNCRPGVKTALARVGAVLTDDQGQKFKIKKSKLRGVESSGMLCAADEIGLADTEQEGIIEFAQEMKVGLDLASHFSDVVFEIGLTPNLGHCNSALGVARELSAATGSLAILPAINIQEDQLLHTSGLIHIDVQDVEKCPRYTCRVIKDVSVGPSPEWLVQRLKAIGIRTVNNVVDITNYVFHEMGQPLHAFDYDSISGQKIIVRTARDGENFITLDDKPRVLTRDDLLICDEQKAIAIAGVMGGKNSEVTPTTQNILLEAAYFKPQAVRKTSKRLALQTDSSKRFERGADPNAVLWALDRAAMLIQQLAHGKVAQNALDIKKQAFPELVIPCRLTRINHLLGINLGVSEVEALFKRLGFTYSWDGHHQFNVTVPTYRVDLLHEIDLIEEVARIYGYDHISRSPPLYKSSNIPHAPIFLFERTVRDRLTSEGLQEFLTCDLIGPSILECIGKNEVEPERIQVMNPISVEQSILRTSLLPGLLQLVKHNIAHQNHDISGFELGRIHFKNEGQYKEQSVAGIILTGKAQPHAWDAKDRESDFYDLKGIIENVLRELRIFNITFKENDLSTFHSGRQAAIFVNSLEVGSLGEIHPSITRKLDVDQRVYFAELNIHDLFQVRQSEYIMADIPIYPASERDWTITVNEDTSLQAILDILHKVPSNLLKKISLLDIYRSDKLGAGLKNVTLRFIYRDDQKTLSQDEVDKEHAHVIEETLKKLEK
ncbi:MAG: phenylalanine--tRNA ligase subunit beta [Chlamydiales bacterium 38-26]|nr:phenylalanine--tRNA ligase subunit beta [Chlamydiales bacterium]OJV08280.1 MAG: phenylalanine--tRNA ligase subunit beta [Chlamydiales bacterium 38-26]